MSDPPARSSPPPDVATSLPHDLFDNPYTYEKLLRLYARDGVLLGLLVPAVLTGVLSFVVGLSGRGQGGALALSWALVVALAPLTVVAGGYLRAKRRAPFYAAFLAQSLVQFVWLQHLCWTRPAFVVVGAALLCVWAFNDAATAYDSPLVRTQYALAFVAFDATLLIVDALGGRGILYAWRHDRGTFDALVTTQLSLFFATQAIVHFAGAQAYAHDRRVLELASLDRELTVTKTERSVLRQSSVYLLQGLAATQFCHDVRGPIMVLTMNVPYLRDKVLSSPLEGDSAVAALDALPHALREPLLAETRAWLAELSEVLEECDVGANRVKTMCEQVALAIRNPEVLEERPVGDLLGDAVSEMRALLASQRVQGRDPKTTLEPCALPVSHGHAATLGNLLANAALQRPDETVEVTGRVANEWFYHLTLRDHGVSADDRPTALAKIQRSLSLSPAARSEGARPEARLYSGYGIALMVARVFFVHAGACLAVSSPPEGRGVEFHVLLPRVPFDQIPEGENVAERVLAARLPGAP